jgi:hypothetical protein
VGELRGLLAAPSLFRFADTIDALASTNKYNVDYIIWRLMNTWLDANGLFWLCRQPISQGASADDAAAAGALAEPETEPSEESNSSKSGGFHLEAAVLQAAVGVGKAVLRKPAVLGAAAAAVAVASLALLAIKKSQGGRGKGSRLGKGKRTARGKPAAAADSAGAAADAASVAASSSVYEDARSEVSDAASAKGLANGTSHHDSSSSAASKAAGGKKQAAARKASGPPTTGPLAGLKATSACAPLADGSACVVRRKIAADNSCMFNAVGYVMHASTSKASWLRSVVAQEVSSDQQFYSAAFLGMANAQYCNWIMNPMNWGGGIELAILAKHYNYEIAAWNIETGKCHVFGEDLGAKKCVLAPGSLPDDDDDDDDDDDG